MEVHHPHHPSHKKKWSEYILEFFMLFLAVTLGFFAENIREHYVEKHKAIVSIQNLYKDLKEDSVNYITSIRTRNKQDSCFEIISQLYEKNEIENKIPLLYAAHSEIATRIMPTMNKMASDQLKNSGALNYIEDERLKKEIQSYANDAEGLKIREQREYSYMDRMIDPITTSYFEYKFFQNISAFENFDITQNDIKIKIEIPNNLRLNKQATFDWDNYFSILAMLRTIRKSTDRSYTIPIQKKCNKLIELVREYLAENNALIKE